MINIFEWLESANQSLITPPALFLQSMDEIFVEDNLMNQITLLDIDESGNMYFDAPHAWNPLIGQCQTYDEYIPIDSSLATMTDPPAPTALDQAVVMVLEQLAEASRKILIYFAQTLEIPEIPKEMIFTAKELETLESIIEEIESFVSDLINDVYINKDPQSTEIKDVIDLRRISPSRQIFYLAKTIEGDYYWFHIPRAEDDKQLR